MAAHLDPVNGDCEEMQAPCPLTQIGCSETKVCDHELSLRFFHLLIFISVLSRYDDDDNKANELK